MQLRDFLTASQNRLRSEITWQKLRLSLRVETAGINLLTRLILPSPSKSGDQDGPARMDCSQEVRKQGRRMHAKLRMLLLALRLLQILTRLLSAIC